MFSLFHALSLRYVRFYPMRSLLIILSIALGVATWVATEALQLALRESVLESANPAGALAVNSLRCSAWPSLGHW